MKNLGKLLLILSIQSLMLQACGQDDKSETKGKGEAQGSVMGGKVNPDGTIAVREIVAYEPASDGSFYVDVNDATTQADGTIVSTMETVLWSDGVNEHPVCEKGRAPTFKDEKGHAWAQDAQTQGVCKVITP